jgi:hypothetical protein
MKRLIVVVILVTATGCGSVSPPAPHPGAPDWGTARWGYAVAQPAIAGFASDAALYEILGTQIYRDGRLPANTGDWSFVAWSPSLKQIFQVTVKFDGTSSTTTRSANAPPSQNSQALAANWADSTTVFAAVAPSLTCGVTHAELAVLNVASYAEAPNQPAWGLHFDVGQNQLVRWDGVYIGSQGAPDVPCGANLKSKFLHGDACAISVIGGTAYDMNDPLWLVNVSDQNRGTCAYKFFSAFHMLGYNTEVEGNSLATDPQVRALNRFQSARGLPVTPLMAADVLLQLDSLLVQREGQIAAVAANFPLYDYFQPLHPHDVSKDWLAYVYQLPMSVLPAGLQMGAAETAYCIAGQCVGSIQDAAGNELALATAMLSINYRFVGAYFDPRMPHWRLPSAAVDVGTVLHEYAHYIDGNHPSPSPDPSLPHKWAISTRSFYDISYDMNQVQAGCALRRSNDPKDWITKYGFVGGALCPQGQGSYLEEWAEAFSMYVAAGKVFRTAAQQNPVIAQKYDWIRTNVFQGVEYDTDLQRDVESGCNDVPGYQQSQPGYASCSEDYVWNAKLPVK